MESGETPWQQSDAPSIGEEAEVADADEALGEQMKQEATEKLIACEGHQLVLIVVQSRRLLTCRFGRPTGGNCHDSRRAPGAGNARRRPEQLPDRKNP